jgi:ABC-type transport system involved in cytochrome c biogenesis permease component
MDTGNLKATLDGLKALHKETEWVGFVKVAKKYWIISVYVAILIIVLMAALLSCYP